MSKSPLIVLGLVVAVVAGKYIYSAVNKPTDKSQIQQALADAIKASKEGRPGSVVDKLSDSFQVNGSQPGMTQIAKYVRENHPDIVVKDTDPVIHDDQAEITSDVDLTINLLGSPRSFTFKDVVLVFKKEAGTDWVFFPTTRWHLSATRIREQDLPSMN